MSCRKPLPRNHLLRLECGNLTFSFDRNVTLQIWLCDRLPPILTRISIDAIAVFFPYHSQIDGIPIREEWTTAVKRVQRPLLGIERWVTSTVRFDVSTNATLHFSNDESMAISSLHHSSFCRKINLAHVRWLCGSRLIKHTRESVGC